MLKKLRSDLYTSTLLSAVTGVTHGYSGRVHGDARIALNREKIVGYMGLSSACIVWPKQTHGNTVCVIDDSDCGSTIPGVDALVFVRRHTRLGTVPILCVHTADCVPLLFADEHAHIFAAAHAGWRGTLLSIATRTVKEMVRHGAANDRIIASIGPHIGSCCYDIPEERAALFYRQGNGNRALVKRNGSWYLSLATAITHELIAAGVSPHHIDESSLCTSCQREIFYSFRRDGSASYGEMMGFITIQSSVYG